MEIVGSELQTKEWRTRQSWYDGGKHNECEKHQRAQIEEITGESCMTTHERIHMTRKCVETVRSPLKEEDAFEWTENFDGKQMRSDGTTLYYNLKMICSDGGSQNRSLREVYHFIKAQHHCVANKVYFINILDGDTCYKYKDQFRVLRSDPRIFVGDMKTFSEWYKDTFVRVGQFYTTQYEYILRGMAIPDGTTWIVEPFCGRGDLLGFIRSRRSEYRLECYDIDPKQPWIVQRDVNMDPPEYSGKFILTNPPYLSRNKSRDKTVFDKYKTNDLYKCFLLELIRQKPSGGILIIPLNFWCSSRASDVALRCRFLEVFRIEHLNIFEEQVFDDTSYTVCSFLFSLSTDSGMAGHYLPISVYPLGEQMDVFVYPETYCLIGGEIHQLPSDGRYTVFRLLDQDVIGMTRLLLKCIDDSGFDIGLRVMADGIEPFYDRTLEQSERSYATLVIQPALSIDEQADLAVRFNTFLNEKRKQYHSLFLNNFREYGRKRITFTLAYSIVRHLLSRT